ncbi:MAG: hypothetical protein H7338_18165 [Candidatus Sericytochromatia bacterium]|nr:hypothetical protein [Candidatus Sericytochromatia bacterium]
MAWKLSSLGHEALRQRIGEASMGPVALAQSSRLVAWGRDTVRRRAEAITDRTLRGIVLGLLDNPTPYCDPQAGLSRLSFEVAAGGSWLGHHPYPGGLVVHTGINLRRALDSAALYREVYDLTVDEDLLAAAVILHDVMKAYTNQFYPRWDDRHGCFYEPETVRKGGLFAKWGDVRTMGHHNELVVAEMMVREAPPELVFATHCHQDQYADSRRNHRFVPPGDETWERTVEEALRKVPDTAAAPYRDTYLDERFRTLEAGLNYLSDGDWVITGAKAGPIARKALVAVIEAAGLVTDSREANLTALWLFSKLDPMRILGEWQLGGLAAAQDLIVASLIDPSDLVVS